MIAVTLQRMIFVALGAALLVALDLQAAAAWLIFVGTCISAIVPSQAPRKSGRWRLPFLGRRRRRTR